MTLLSALPAAVMPLNRRLLDALVESLPRRFDTLFEQAARVEGEKGACVTYSQILAETLGEFGIRAEVRPVFIITANQVGIDYREGKITEEKARSRGGRLQYWGDIREGQSYQHAVCYIPEWDATIDLGMAKRGSGLVPSHPYWAEDKMFPWWLQRFQFMHYLLENRGYTLYPEKVAKAKAIAREVIQKWL